MISLICANPTVRESRLPNTGMLSVDLAFHQFAARHFPRSEVGFFTAGEVPEFPGAGFGLPFRYRDYRAEFERVLASAAIVFWGDFLQAHAYHRIDLPKRGFDDGAILAQYFLADCGPEIFRKVIVFGGSLMSDVGVESAAPAYRAAAGRFFQRVPHVYMRDVISDLKVRSLVDSWGAQYLGADCALLFDGELAMADAGGPLPKSGNIGIFFGRTLLNMRHFFFLSRQLGELEGKGLEWLHWIPLTRAGREFLEKKFADVDLGVVPRSVVDIYRKLASFEYIVTDTYHLSIVAWRMGVPVVCIGEGARRKPTTLDDKKKETLFTSYNAELFYLFAERLSSASWRSKAAKEISRVVHDGAITGLVHRNLLAHGAWTGQTLKRCLDDVLK